MSILVHPPLIVLIVMLISGIVDTEIQLVFVIHYLQRRW